MKIIFPPLDIKLGFMNQFVIALPSESDCFKYLILVFPGLSNEKIKAVAFDGPRQFIKDEDGMMLELEKNALLSFKDLVKNFLQMRQESHWNCPEMRCSNLCVS